MVISMNYIDKYNSWLEFADSEIKKELEDIKGNDNEIKERFALELEFGTGGLRGIMGAGTNRMNIYTVRRATCGLAKYIKKTGAQDKGVAIAYDSRHNSQLFALEAAKVLAREGVKAYLFDALRPTPELSFAVRHLSCAAGIVVTASHNPKEYNGYKVYGEDGGQVVFEAADAITEYISTLNIFKDVDAMDEQEAIDKGLLTYIGAEVDEAFYAAVLNEAINPECAAKSDLKIVYTPFHGAGNIPVREILRRIGIKNVIVVPEQELPDGDFPTVKSPNPENPEGFALAIELAKKENCSLIIGTDPDADRTGIIVRNTSGEYIALTGNQTGALIVEYVLSQRKEKGTLPQNAVVIKTIVTNEIINRITEFYAVELVDVLTGFKYIAEKIKEYEQTGEKAYVFGFEESYGYLPGTYVRDKDAVGASMLIASMAAWYGARGMSLYDGLCEIYEKYGHYGEWTDNIYFEGIDGMEKINAIMERLRENAPKEIGGSAVTAYMDVQKGFRYDALKNERVQIDLPESNVLRYETEDGSFIAFRPSGTEPKFKVYAGFVSENHEDKKKKIEADIRKLIG